MVAIRSRLQLVIAFLLVILLAVVLWFVGGRKLFEKQMTPWVKFEVPPNAPALDASCAAHGRVITICNQSGRAWQKVAVRIDGGYIKEFGNLQPGECRTSNVDEYAYPTWKKLPPPKDMLPKTVEVLASEEVTAYIRRTVQ